MIGCNCVQNKYKQNFRESLAFSLYSQLPQTAETQLAAKVTDLQSQVGSAPLLLLVHFVLSLLLCGCLSCAE